MQQAAAAVERCLKDYFVVVVQVTKTLVAISIYIACPNPKRLTSQEENQKNIFTPTQHKTTSKKLRNSLNLLLGIRVTT